jgi:uracil phosphoribosyltransferase
VEVFADFSSGVVRMASVHPQVVELNHSLAQHHLSQLRARETRPAQFRQHVFALSTLLAAEVTRNLRLKSISVQTPLEVTEGHALTGRVAAVPILRAGLGMVAPLADLIPELEVWHLGLYRDEATAMPVHYYDKLPENDPPDVAIVLDPMLATGGSACLAIDAIQRWGAKEIFMLSIISAPEGVARVVERFADLRIYTCAVDRGLNERKYIVPGLGDAGDRIFNT